MIEREWPLFIVSILSMEQTYCFPGHIHPYPGFGSEILDNSPLDVFPSSSSSFESPSDDLEPYIHPVQSFISIALPETVPDSCFPHIHSGVPPSVSSTPVAHVESQSTASSLYCAPTREWCVETKTRFQMKICRWTRDPDEVVGSLCVLHDA